jgi:hypothetical protein
MSNLRGKTVALDYDGVLHSYTSGWTGEAPTDPPHPGALEFVQDLIDQGAKVVVYSTRAKTYLGRVGMLSWFREHGFPLDADNITNEKPPAIAYVDDRAVEFRGDFAQALAGINELAAVKSGQLRPAVA